MNTHGWIILVTCLFFVGCQQDDGNLNPVTQAETSQSDQAQVESNTSKEVTVKIQDWKETEKLIASHKGKIVVLDLWSTSCEPCIREFPNLVALHQKYGNDTVVCISGSCEYDGLDAPEELLEDVLEILREQNATFDNVLFNVEYDELWKKLKIASVPVVYVYGPDGQIAKRFDNEAGGEFTYEKDIFPFIEKLLAPADEK